MLEFDWLEFFIHHVIDNCLTGSHMLGSQLGKFLILILFKQLLSVKIFLGQEKKIIRN